MTTLLLLLVVLFKALVVAGATFGVTFLLCSLFPAVGKFLVRLLGFDK